jgi:Carboxypeptidase regulatory-like domain
MKNVLYYILGATVVLCLGTSCSKSYYSTVKVLVKSSEGQARKNAHVHFMKSYGGYESDMYTDASGMVEFPQVQRGTYNIRVEDKAYVSAANLSVEVKNDEAKEVSVIMQ